MRWTLLFAFLMVLETQTFGQHAGWPDDLFYLFCGASMGAILAAAPWKKQVTPSPDR